MCTEGNQQSQKGYQWGKCGMKQNSCFAIQKKNQIPYTLSMSLMNSSDQWPYKGVKGKVRLIACCISTHWNLCIPTKFLSLRQNIKIFKHCVKEVWFHVPTRISSSSYHMKEKLMFCQNRMVRMNRIWMFK